MFIITILYIFIGVTNVAVASYCLSFLDFKPIPIGLAGVAWFFFSITITYLCISVVDHFIKKTTKVGRLLLSIGSTILFSVGFLIFIAVILSNIGS